MSSEKIAVPLQLEDAFDDDVDEYPAHLKGDETMAPVSYSRSVSLDPVYAFSLSKGKLFLLLEKKMKSQLEGIIRDTHPDFYKNGFYHASVRKASPVGFRGVAESGMQFFYK